MLYKSHAIAYITHYFNNLSVYEKGEKKVHARTHTHTHTHTHKGTTNKDLWAGYVWAPKELEYDPSSLNVNTSAFYWVMLPV